MTSNLQNINIQVNRYLCETGIGPHAFPPSESTSRITKLWPLTQLPLSHITIHIKQNIFYDHQNMFYYHRLVPFLNLCTEDCRWSQQRAEPHPWPEQVTDDQASIWGLSPGTEANTRLKPDDILDLVSVTWQQSRTKELSFMIAVHQCLILLNNGPSHPV